MEIKIRQASIKDLDAVTEVEMDCFPEAEAATKVSLELRIKTFPESFFVAELNGEIIGFVNGCVINGTVIYDDLFKDSTLHIKKGDYQTIFGLDVMPNYRNQGIAAQLMNYMIEVSRIAGRKGVILTCKKELIYYYTKFGYVDKGISKSVHGGSIWYDLILEF
ncbi:GNAT family N-acetyltransferase [Clostridium bowmanii]|uniref:GNAT family N-acetyltransferase n=1 Tax=Clostridium bowmanii TaxID=132925 RepID=UPI001C0AF178|nr:GNAT family N-acetyltransferase [Clostridium bowmanii]MBU3191966.1 GNAT family N-acetyltransferase [Clostridium bowmanii]MCA1076221.1 GNAT family N-acetyltransferase [Clostridium bowmanii]